MCMKNLRQERTERHLALAEGGEWLGRLAGRRSHRERFSASLVGRVTLLLEFD